MKKILLSLHLNIIYLILYFTLIPSISHSLNIEYRKLDCIPELQHYSFGESFLTEEWSHLEEHYPKNARKHLWDTHHMVHDTGWAYSIHPDAHADSTKFEDLEFFEHTCDIGLGIKTRIRSQHRIYPSGLLAGRMMEQIQLFYGNKFVLDSLNEFGCSSFTDVECRNFEFGTQYVEFSRGNITITAAASNILYKKGITKDEDYPKFISSDNCNIYFLDVEIFTHWIEEGKKLGIKNSLEPSKTVELPLTREKIKQIIQNEYDSGSPSYKESESGEEIDKCHLKVEASPIR